MPEVFNFIDITQRKQDVVKGSDFFKANENVLKNEFFKLVYSALKYSIGMLKILFLERIYLFKKK